MSDLELVGLTKRFDGADVVADVSLRVASGEFISLLGPSGSGKTTTLRMIAGFVEPTVGEVRIDGVDVARLPPERRGVGVVFQNYALFPHMTVAENIAFGLKLRGKGKEAISRLVAAALNQVGLPDYGQRNPKSLSGGQQQRVALARVLVTEPRLLLLDEPLSALDKNLREEMKIWIKGLHKQLGITMIYVTHDQSEALTLSDRVGIMNGGRLVQTGTPREVYERPRDLFVAEFVGESSTLDATVRSVAAGRSVLAIDLETTLCFPAELPFGPGRRVKLIVRPETMMLDRPEDPAWMTMPATVTSEIYRGAMIEYQLRACGQTITALTANQVGLAPMSVGMTTRVSWPAERTQVIPVADNSR